MLTHDQIWSAIDALAKQNMMSTSGLARNSGLDPTTFNKSKRFTASGRERWPSTESLAKILHCTGTSIFGFFELIEPARLKKEVLDNTEIVHGVPLIGFAQAGVGGFFDDGGFPVGQGWDEIAHPSRFRENSYALRVSGDSMLPLYRDGDVIIVDPAAQVRKGDRVVAKTKDGEVMAKILVRRNTTTVELESINPDHKNRIFKPGDLEWLARITWASQ